MFGAGERLVERVVKNDVNLRVCGNVQMIALAASIRRHRQYTWR